MEFDLTGAQYVADDSVVDIELPAVQQTVESNEVDHKTERTVEPTVEHTVEPAIQPQPNMCVRTIENISTYMIIFVAFIGMFIYSIIYSIIAIATAIATASVACGLYLVRESGRCVLCILDCFVCLIKN